jgi:hypothetical protein
LRRKREGGDSIRRCWQSLLAWTYFVRPTNAIPIAAITIYLFVYHRRSIVPYVVTGAAWGAGFIAYSWYHFGHLLPGYYGEPLKRKDVLDGAFGQSD